MKPWLPPLSSLFESKIEFSRFDMMESRIFLNESSRVIGRVLSASIGLSNSSDEAKW